MIRSAGPTGEQRGPACNWRSGQEVGAGLARKLHNDDCDALFAQIGYGISSGCSGCGCPFFFYISIPVLQWRQTLYMYDGRGASAPNDLSLSPREFPGNPSPIERRTTMNNARPARSGLLPLVRGRSVHIDDDKSILPDVILLLHIHILTAHSERDFNARRLIGAMDRIVVRRRLFYTISRP